MTRGGGGVRSALASSGATALLVAAVSAPFLFFAGKSLASTAVVFLINVCLVLALQSFVGNSGILSFGHVAFMGVGAYVTAWLTIPPAIKADQLPGLPAWLAEQQMGLLEAAAAGAVASAILAAIVGLVLVRMTVNAMVMATFALLLVMFSVWLNWSEFTRGSNGVFGLPRLVSPTVALFAAIAFIVLVRVFKSTRIGLRLRATREDELASGSAGINVRLTRYLAWVFSAALMGVGGSLWALNIMAFDPGQFSFVTTFALLAMLIIGGRESVLGGIVGAALIVIVTEVFSRVEQGVSVGGFELPRITGTVQFVIAALIIIALIWRPEGIVGRREVEDVIPPLGRALRRSRSQLVVEPESAVHPERDSVVLAGKGLYKAFRGVQAVDGIDIEVHTGEILGLIGPNGSGKSTLLNLLSGVTPADSGSVVVNGRPVSGFPAYKVARSGVSRTFQNIRLFSHLSVDDNVLAPDGATVAVADTTVERLGLAPHLFAQADSLSYGMQRRLEIARAISTRPSVVMLDEPAAGMNHSESDILLGDIRALATRYGCGVIIIDHDLRLIMRLCDRIQVLTTGRTIAIGTPAQILADPAVAAAYLGDSAADLAGEGAVGSTEASTPATQHHEKGD